MIGQLFRGEQSPLKVINAAYYKRFDSQTSVTIY